LQASADLGRTFGRVAEAYDRLRPEFAPEAIDHVVAALGLSPDATVLDLAAGTGKLTRPLRERLAHVIAVEPDTGMRAFVGGDARAGSAEAIPLADASVDAVFVGDAFPWFDAPRALAEIERVLRPGGGFALLWRDWFQREEPPMPAEVTHLLGEVFYRFRGTARGDWRDAVGPLEHASFERRLTLSGRDLADLELTRSSPALLDDDERAALAAGIYPHMAPSYELTVVTEVDWR
jgi:ubiquinone/menaquinone biosynthesis C-methylase UbiE